MKKLFFLLALVCLWVLSLSATTIYDVQFNNSTQGSGDDCYPSPEEGNTVTVSGIATAVASPPRFWIEELEGGLWRGIYVYDYSFNVQRGDSVTVTAPVSEYYGMTELYYQGASCTIHSRDNSLPDPIDISTGDLSGGCSATAEAYEGVLVRVKDVVVDSAADGYGQWWVNDGSGVCQIEDGLLHYEPNVGYSIVSITGVVTYSFGQYEINPRDMSDMVLPGGPPPVLSIYDVQFNDSNPGGAPPDTCYPSPYADSLITITGIVAGITRNIGYDNFWIQDSVRLWSGVYIFDNTISPSIGDSITITGSISEYHGLTEVTVSEYEIHARAFLGLRQLR